MSDIPSTGVMPDSKFDDDNDYVDEFIAGIKPARKLPAQARLPIDEIERVLASPVYSTERGTDEHMREVCADRQPCPLCSNYDHYDRYLLQQHIAQHQEVKAYLQDASATSRRRDQLLNRRLSIKDSLARLRNELIEIDSRIDGLDKSAQERERQATRLLRLLHT